MANLTRNYLCNFIVVVLSGIACMSDLHEINTKELSDPFEVSKHTSRTEALEIGVHLVGAFDHHCWFKDVVSMTDQQFLFSGLDIRKSFSSSITGVKECNFVYDSHADSVEYIFRDREFYQVEGLGRATNNSIVFITSRIIEDKTLGQTYQLVLEEKNKLKHLDKQIKIVPSQATQRAYPLDALLTLPVLIHPGAGGDLIVSLNSAHGLQVLRFDKNLLLYQDVPLLLGIGEPGSTFSAPLIAHDSSLNTTYASIRVSRGKRPTLKSLHDISLEEFQQDNVSLILGIDKLGKVSSFFVLGKADQDAYVTAITARRGHLAVSGTWIEDGKRKPFVTFAKHNVSDGGLRTIWSKTIKNTDDANDNNLISSLRISNRDRLIISGSLGLKQAPTGSVLKGGNAFFSCLNSIDGNVDHTEFLTQEDGTSSNISDLLQTISGDIIIITRENIPLTHAPVTNLRKTKIYKLNGV